MAHLTAPYGTCRIPRTRCLTSSLKTGKSNLSNALEVPSDPQCWLKGLYEARPGGQAERRVMAQALPDANRTLQRESLMRFGSLFRRWAVGGASVMCMVSVAGAQIPGSPVLQNAFVNPGITAAVNFANLGGSSSYAAAAAWAPASARAQLSAGIGLQTRSNSSTRTIYGARLNFPVFGAGRSLGVSLFGGYGGLSGGTIDSTVAKALIPIGATVSYRLAFGGSRGISLYGSPIYEAVTRGGGASAASLFRGSIGLDVGITSSIGATLGMELGATYDATTGKPSGTAFGAAISYAIGARR